MIVHVVGAVFAVGLVLAAVSVEALEQGHPFWFCGLAATGIAFMFASAFVLQTINIDWNDWKEG